MKKTIGLLLLILSPHSFAKSKVIEFNQLIENQVKSQNETHSALAIELGSLLISEKSSSDSNRIKITNQEIHIQASQTKGLSQKIRLGSSDQLENNDFNRIDRELGSSN